MKDSGGEKNYEKIENDGGKLLGNTRMEKKIMKKVLRKMKGSDGKNMILF